MKKTAILLGALALFLAQSVGAQTFTPSNLNTDQLPESPASFSYEGLEKTWSATFTIGGENETWFFGPYIGSFPGTPSFNMYCVDFLAGVSNTAWDVNISPVTGDLSLTRIKDQATYRQMAFLSSLFSAENGMTRNNWSALHAAIWTLAGANITAIAGTGIAVDVMDLVTHYLNLAASTSFNASNWYVLTAVDPFTLQRQEFMIEVSEPAALILLLSGLLGVVYLARRRSTGLA